jgi:hypothetical protein
LSAKKSFWFIIAIVSLLTSPVFAARPLITDDIFTTPKGEYQLEFGYETLQTQTSLINAATLMLRRGLLSNCDLGIEIPYATSSPAGLNDVYLHLGYRFWERSQNEGMAVRTDYKFKNGDVSKKLGSGDDDYWLLLIYSKIFNTTRVHLNFGYVNVGVNAGLQSDDYLMGSIAVEQPVWGDKGELVAEYVSNNTSAPSSKFIQLGARYIVFSGFKLDAGYSFGLNNNSIKNDLTAGLQWEF